MVSFVCDECLHLRVGLFPLRNKSCLTCHPAYRLSLVSRWAFQSSVKPQSLFLCAVKNRSLNTRLCASASAYSSPRLHSCSLRFWVNRGRWMPARPRGGRGRGRGSHFGWTRASGIAPSSPPEAAERPLHLAHWQPSLSFHFQLYELACMHEETRAHTERESENAHTLFDFSLKPERNSVKQVANTNELV